MSHGPLLVLVQNEKGMFDCLSSLPNVFQYTILAFGNASGEVGMWR